MRVLLCVALGGSVGAVVRYLASKHINLLFPLATIPLGTLVVNLVGAIIIGFLFALFNNYLVSIEIKALLTAGILGGLTTFSTFSLETVNLIRQQQLMAALINVMLNNILSLVFVFVGSYIFTLIHKIIK